MQAPLISFEYFPPKTEQGLANLLATAEALKANDPSYFSVTYGAGGSTQARTTETVQRITETTGVKTAPHISCITASKKTITELLRGYQQLGIDHLVALRGDVPSGIGPGYSDFACARDLVRFIRETTGDHFHIEVAVYPEFHPQAGNIDADLNYFKQKVEAGANSALTQYFYNADSYFHLRDHCQRRHINIPIVPGIMPITNAENIIRFSKQCGADIPRWLHKHLDHYAADQTALLEFGETVVTQLCEKLLAGGAPGLHFYTLNKAKPSLAILKNLKTEI